MDRRDMLRVIGGAAIFGATAGCASGADLAAAWRNPGAGETDPRRQALAWAILAPNPHNMQPWRVDLRTPGEATLYVDPDRLLPVSDPFNRQIAIGCGAFLELMRMAAARGGWRADITPFPVGEAQPGLGARPLARVTFARAAPFTDPLFPAILNRRTNRTAYKDKPVDPAVAARIADAARSSAVAAAASVAPTEVARLKALVFQGARVEAYTPAANRESVEHMYFGAADLRAHPYGVALRGPAIELAHAAGLVTHATLEREGSFAFDQALKYLKTGADTARGFVWLTTADNSRAAQLSAGGAYLRANLQATALGIAMQPWSQCLEEYPTMAETFGAVHRELAPRGGRIQMLARLGEADPVPPAPKRGVDAQIYRP